MTTTFAPIARFDAPALTRADFERYAPSVLATSAHESRSERFYPISTWDVLQGLEREGFYPVSVKQSTTRVEGKAPFTKHLIRLRRLGSGSELYRTGDTIAEMLLKNANDGTSAYELMAGLFRIACQNGMVTQTATLDSLKVRHTGRDVIRAVVDGTYQVAEAAQKSLAAPQEWARLTLEPDHRQALAAAAHVLRFSDAEGNVETPIQPEQLLRPHRTADTGRDLWSTFNVVQENVIRGGVTAIGRDAHGRRRRTTTRPINGIDQDVRLNKALWVLGERLAAAVR